MTSIHLTATDRAAIYQADKVEKLRKDLAACRLGVQQGFGSALVPFVGVTMAELLEALEAELLEAEADLAFLNTKRGAVQ